MTKDEGNERETKDTMEGQSREKPERNGRCKVERESEGHESMEENNRASQDPAGLVESVIS